MTRKEKRTELIQIRVTAETKRLHKKYVDNEVIIKMINKHKKLEDNE